MCVHQPALVLIDEQRREYPEVAGEQYQVHAVLLEAFDDVGLVLLPRDPLVRECVGIDAVLLSPLERERLGYVRYDNGHVPVDLAALARVDHALEVRSATRGQDPYPCTLHGHQPSLAAIACTKWIQDFGAA